MADDGDRIELREYSRLRPSYERLVDEVKFALGRRIDESGLKVAQVLGRVKPPDSLIEKLSRKKYTDPLREITDLAGVRVVCLYEPDVETIAALTDREFEVLEASHKASALGPDRMGYQGVHIVVRLGPRYSGPRYDDLKDLVCEIQLRTALQDAWALISHHLVYKSESAVPVRLRRDLNNVAAALEIAQGVLDSVYEKREAYVRDIRSRELEPADFLSQPIDHDTLVAYTRWKYPNLPVSEGWSARLLDDLDRQRYKTLRDIDQAVEAAREAVAMYAAENPAFFGHATDYITKSLGFTDASFRERHPFAERTLEAFQKHADRVKRGA